MTMTMTQPLLCPACKTPGHINSRATAITEHKATFDPATTSVVSARTPANQQWKYDMLCTSCDTSFTEELVVEFNSRHYLNSRPIALPMKNSNGYYILSNIDSHGSTRDELASLSGVTPTQTEKSLELLTERDIVSPPGDDERWHLTDYGRLCQKALLESLAAV
jgi:hypothetical protein